MQAKFVKGTIQHVFLSYLVYTTCYASAKIYMIITIVVKVVSFQCREWSCNNSFVLTQYFYQACPLLMQASRGINTQKLQNINLQVRVLIIQKYDQW